MHFNVTRVIRLTQLAPHMPVPASALAAILLTAGQCPAGPPLRAAPWRPPTVPGRYFGPPTVSLVRQTMRLTIARNPVVPIAAHGTTCPAGRPTSTCPNAPGSCGRPRNACSRSACRITALSRQSWVQQPRWGLVTSGPAVGGFAEFAPGPVSFPSPASGDQGRAQAKPASATSATFATAAIHTTFYFPRDHYRTYLWLKTSAGSARNLVNGIAARIPGQASVILSGRAVTFGDLDVNAAFCLLSDIRRTQPWTKVSKKAARNPLNGAIRRMSDQFIVLP
jgi:hypothetical protein